MNQKLPRDQISISLQIQHQQWDHHPRSLYKGIDPNFVKKIEQKDNPSIEYRDKIKGVYLDQLQKGLEQYKLRQSKQGQIIEETKKDYKQKINGILSELQKNQLKRKNYYQKCNNKQQARKKNFIDDNQKKQEKIQQYVYKYLDKDKFYHIDDQYKSQQLKLFNQTRLIMDLQTLKKEQEKEQEKYYQHRQYQFRLLRQYNFNQQKLLNQQKRKENQSKYYLDLSKLIQEKNKSTHENLVPKQSKHNPITNPIEYHIENPYLLQRIQNKYKDRQPNSRY